MAWRAWGTTEPDGTALDLSTPFYAGSIAKQFTAACIASLVLDGHLHLGMAVRGVLPQLPESLDGIEIEHLVMHTSGLPESDLLDGRIGFHGQSQLSNADRLAGLSTVELETPPGRVHRYNNYGYVLLAEVVKIVAAEPFGEYARRRLLVPAGMRDSGFLDVEHPRPVPGWSNGTRVDIAFTSVGDGGLITTVEDLLRWNSWLPGSDLAALVLGPRTHLNGALAHDGWGISTRGHHGLRIESHGGSFEGHLCSAMRFPDPGAVFVAMTNTDELGPTQFLHQLRCLIDSVLADQLDRSQPPLTETHGHPVP